MIAGIMEGGGREGGNRVVGRRRRGEKPYQGETQPETEFPSYSHPILSNIHEGCLCLDHLCKLNNMNKNFELMENFNFS